MRPTEPGRHMKASNDDSIIAAIVLVIGLMMAGVGKLIGGW